MKSQRFLLTIVALLVLSSAALAQAVQPAQPPQAVPSGAKAAYDKLKTLEGAWEGVMATDPPAPEVQGKLAQVNFRVASRGTVLMHDLRVDGIPDNPLTMLYREGDGLQLTHYCDAGNRPRMNGEMSADGKSVQFDFLDLAGSNQHGHMHGMKFTFVDADRHIEDFTWMQADNKPVRVHFELRRKK